jgi:nucleoid DNA-binding protein
MRQRALMRRAARRGQLKPEEVEAAVRAFLFEAAQVLVSGDTVSLYPLGELYPIELAEDGRRKRRGVRFLPSTYMVELMGRNRPISIEDIEGGRIVIGDLVAFGGG